MQRKQYKLIIFDVDGTLVSTLSGARFRKSAVDWYWLPGRKEKLRELKEQGVRLACASNQGGVAFGYLPLADIRNEIHHMAREGGIPPGGVYICYNHPYASNELYRHEDNRRKPAPGMLIEAMFDFQAGNEDTLMVGDRDEDMQAARAAGCDFCWSSLFFGDESAF